MTSSTWGGEWWEREIGEICKTLLYLNPRPPPAHAPFFFTTLNPKRFLWTAAAVAALMLSSMMMSSVHAGEEYAPSPEVCVHVFQRG